MLTEKSYDATIRLGVATSVIGFAALFLSGFPGLKQLAVFSIAGLITAVLVTRFVLPIMTGPHHQGASFDGLDARLHRWSEHSRRWRWLTLFRERPTTTVSRLP